MNSRPDAKNKNKYIFTDQNYKPICIMYYANDDIAIKEAEKMAHEEGRVVYIVRHLGPENQAK
jgi:hypothetical protein